MTKVWCHIALRTAKNLVSGPHRITPTVALSAAPVVAEHRSPLWSDGRADEYVLRCGKVQNLRMACRRFDGIEVAAGEVLSFWAQVGRPSRLRGFAVGREIVNGCVVPTVGGGLCQLSNALAAVAVSVGARLLERHRHSALIEAQAPSAEDATVAWNHVDLRIAAEFAFRVEAELTADELLVRVRSHHPVNPVVRSSLLPRLVSDRQVARGCLTCDRTACFRHRPQALVSQGRTAVLLNDRYPELATWLAETRSDADWMLPWVRPGLRRNAWSPPPKAAVQMARWPSWKRILQQRFTRGEGGRRQAGRLRAARDLARAYARWLRPEHTHLVVTQDLLVPLWRLGVLAGRTFDVYAHELPASEIQMRLDAAAAQTPVAASLKDFRVDPSWQRDEWRALARARSCLTPHAEVHRVLAAAGLEPELLPWDEVAAQPVGPTGNEHLTLTLAASALPRKGSAEVLAAARALKARVQILGSPPGNPNEWAGIDWFKSGYDSDWLAKSDLVLLPAFVEHQPRALLRALAAGVPVIASAACGLGTRPGLTLVTPGDPSALVSAIRTSLVARAAVALHASRRWRVDPD